MAFTKIVFLTNSEYGQSNVILATAHELLVRGNCEVHIVSYNPLKKRVEDLNDGAFGKIPNSGRIVFHLLSGESMHEARMTKFNIPSIDHAPTIKGATDVYHKLAILAGTRNGEEYIQSYRECREVIESVNPDAIIVEEIFLLGVDACRELGREYLILSPVTFRERPSSFKDSLLKYPAKCSGHPFPLPRRRIPANIYLHFRLIHTFLTAEGPKDMFWARKEEGIKGRFPAFVPVAKDVTYLFPSTPESDFPTKLPPNFIPCGPITLPSPPLAEVDPTLETWLQGRPTVLVCLGTFLRPNSKYSTELAKGIKILLDHNSTLQVLWKLKHDGDLQADIVQMLSEHISTGRLRIEKWLKPQPSAIVASGAVVAYVHHGGANSYFEAISAGAPQVILPCWYDTYEFAARVEYLGIGIYGSKKSRTAPIADGIELGEALIMITDHEGGRSMREMSKALAKVCNAYGGRGRAAEKILEVAAKRQNVINGVKEEKHINM